MYPVSLHLKVSLSTLLHQHTHTHTHTHTEDPVEDSHKKVWMPENKGGNCILHYKAKISKNLLHIFFLFPPK